MFPRLELADWNRPIPVGRLYVAQVGTALYATGQLGVTSISLADCAILGSIQLGLMGDVYSVYSNVPPGLHTCISHPT